MLISSTEKGTLTAPLPGDGLPDQSSSLQTPNRPARCTDTPHLKEQATGLTPVNSFETQAALPRNAGISFVYSGRLTCDRARRPCHGRRRIEEQAYDRPKLAHPLLIATNPQIVQSALVVHLPIHGKIFSLF